MLGSIETAYDGHRWCNRVVGSYTVAVTRDTVEDAVRKGRAMAEVRGVEHVIKNRDGVVIRRVRY